jgi:hypothetical protein
VGIPALVLLALFLDRRPEMEWGKRQIANWIGIGGLIYFIVFSFLIIEGIADIHRDAPLWYYSMGVFLFIGYFQDWKYVMKRDNARWWQTFHIFFVAFLVISMSANTLFHYFGDIREWNILSRPLMEQMTAGGAMTQDVAFDTLERTRAGLNLWHTPAAAVAAGKPKGLELWIPHVLGWLACIVAGTVVGLMRWSAKRDAELAALEAKAKAKSAAGAPA